MILQAILLGATISITFIGPIYFMLLEISITKGWKTALIFNLGALTADIVCIILAYFGSQQLLAYVKGHPVLTYIGGGILIGFGLITYFTAALPKKEYANTLRSGYVMNFAKGLAVNSMNVGIVVFWFVILSWATVEYQSPLQIQLFLIITMLTVFFLDLMKILLAQKLQAHITDLMLLKMRKGIALFIVLFGLIVVGKSFFM